MYIYIHIYMCMYICIHIFICIQLPRAAGSYRALFCWDTHLIASAPKARQQRREGNCVRRQARPLMMRKLSLAEAGSLKPAACFSQRRRKRTVCTGRLSQHLQKYVTQSASTQNGPSKHTTPPSEGSNSGKHGNSACGAHFRRCLHVSRRRQIASAAIHPD